MTRTRPMREELDLGMQVLIMTALTCLSAISFVAAGLVPVRLVDGPSIYEGRVEVFYNSTWGTVCDDKMNDDNCVVVCNQLGFQGGVFITNAASHYGSGTGEIWLDDVNCSGREPDLDACLHRFWGINDCKHDEDTGCRCSPPTGPVILPPPGTCDSHRHHIRPFDASYPGIGRAEVQADDGVWYTICDDTWDNTDAAVFCQCLGYTDKTHFRAYWSGELVDMKPSMDILYGGVHCTNAEMDIIQNIWQCQTTPDRGLCDASMESAAVACEPVPSATPPGPPMAHLDCDGDTLTVCYTSTDCTLLAQYLTLEPGCTHATTTGIEDGVCVNIPMSKCTAQDTQTDESSKHYCYDVLYTEPSPIAHLITGNSWARSACCSLDKNGTVLSSFMPHAPKEAPEYITADVNFSISCYHNDTFSGSPLQFPINISRGQDMFCSVSADTWDPMLQLVVPNCRFMARQSGSPSFTFVDQKCPTSAEFGIHYFNLDGHNWGFKFRAPQFEGYNDLFVSCDCYLCDPSLDSKPYCDRTCRSSTGRTRRHVPRQSAHHPTLMEVADGPFHIQETLTDGPMLNEYGALIYAESRDRNRNRPSYRYGADVDILVGPESSAGMVGVHVSVVGMTVVTYFLAVRWISHA